MNKCICVHTNTGILTILLSFLTITPPPHYHHHYELALAKTRKGGFLLADNVLWDGKVVGNDPKDATAQVLRQFNDFVQADHRVENLLLPLRDGLMLMRKIV